MRKNIATYLILLSVLSACMSPGASSAAEQSAASIFAAQANSVVLIGAVINKKVTHLGSGFIVRPDGLIVTNYHVVSGAKEIFIKLKDSQIFPDAKVLSFDEEKDIAFIKIDAAKLRTVVLGNSSTVKIGEQVIVIGNPLGLESTVSDGLISAVRTLNNGRRFLQISVPLSTGSSGSPLFNMKGEVIGVTTSGRLDGQNLNFAIPINSVRSLMLLSKYDIPEEKEKPGAELYTVKPKDTLYAIAKKYATTPETIMKLNGLSDTNISPGQALKVPAKK